MEYDLRPIHHNQKSFHGNATVFENGEYVELRSYKTRVVKIYYGQNPYLLVGKNEVTRTMLIHMKEFLKQHGFLATNKQQIYTDYLYAGV